MTALHTLVGSVGAGTSGGLPQHYSATDSNLTLKTEAFSTSDSNDLSFWTSSINSSRRDWSGIVHTIPTGTVSNGTWYTLIDVNTSGTLTHIFSHYKEGSGITIPGELEITIDGKAETFSFTMAVDTGRMTWGGVIPNIAPATGDANTSLFSQSDRGFSNSSGTDLKSSVMPPSQALAFGYGLPFGTSLKVRIRYLSGATSIRDVGPSDPGSYAGVMYSNFRSIQPWTT